MTTEKQESKKRHYFQNTEIKVEEYNISITTTGRPYLKDHRGAFRNVEHVVRSGSLYLLLPSGKWVRLFAEVGPDGKRVIKYIVLSKDEEGADCKAEDEKQ